MDGSLVQSVNLTQTLHLWAVLPTQVEAVAHARPSKILGDPTKAHESKTSLERIWLQDSSNLEEGIFILILPILSNVMQRVP